MAGGLPLDDGRYLVRSGSGERVMVTEMEGALPPARRRRRRPRKVAASKTPVTVTVSVVTVIRADQPFDGQSAAESWLDHLDDSEFTGDLLEDAVGTLDRVRAADASSSGVPFGTRTDIGEIVAARVGYGEGDQVASGRFLAALDIDARGGTGEKRREKLARTGPMARTAAILTGREEPSACEVLIPRIRFDLETGNEAAARLAIHMAIGATISELEFAVEGEDHEKDLDRLEELLPGLDGISARTGRDGEAAADLDLIEDALAVAERVIRRRRILGQ